MTRARLWPALALAAGLFAVTTDTSAQPPFPPGAVPGQPIPGGRGGPPLREAAVPMVPKSAGAFITLKVSDLASHPDLKPVLAELANQPDALAGITEALGVSPLEIDRLTLFWPRLNPRGGMEPVLVVTTREPFNEARVLKALRAEPVYDGDFGRGHGGGDRWRANKPVTKSGSGPANNPPPGLVDPKGDFVPPKGPGGAAPGPKNVEKGLPPPDKQEDGQCGSSDPTVSDPLFYALDRGAFEALFLIDDRTLVFLPGGPDSNFAAMALTAAALKKNATGPLADAIAAAGKYTFAAAAHLTPLFREIDRDRRTPAELVPYTALFAARTAVLTGVIDKPARLDLTLAFDDAAAAKRAGPVLEEGIASVAEKLGGLVADMKESPRPFDKAAAPLLSSFVGGLKKATVKADGTTVAASAEFDLGPVAAKALADLLQAVQSRKRAVVRMNNLKLIGLALHAYHDTNGRFPANVYGPKGELLLSWRVQLLPYVEEDNLYKQFKLDEPWDSENNKKLIEQMPKVFQAPEREHPKGKTFYQGFAAPDPRKAQPGKGFPAVRPWLVDGMKDGIRLTDIADGSSNTLAVVEARDGVIWSKPDDLPFGGPVPALGEKGWDRTPALRFDGSTLLFPTNLRPEQFWIYVGIDDGMVTPDLDDGRRPFGGRRRHYPAEATPAISPEPAPGAPVPAKEDGPAEKVREFEARVAEATAALRQEEARAALAVAEAERATALFNAGAATAEEVAKARATAEEARKRVQVRKDELTRAQAILDAVRPK